MSKKSTTARRRTDTVMCKRDGLEWGEYVNAGETYIASYPPNRTRRGTIHMQGTKGATFMAPWVFIAAIERGDLEIVGY